MTRRLFLLLIVLFVLTSCGYDTHVDPPLFTYDTDALTLASAQLHARDVGGFVSGRVLNTHSMEPLIKGDDWLVILSSATAPINNAHLRGRVISYHPDWDPKLFCAHRVVSEDSYGLIVEGDHVDGEHPEGKWRVTAANYLGEVIAIYRTVPKA